MVSQTSRLDWRHFLDPLVAGAVAKAFYIGLSVLAGDPERAATFDEVVAEAWQAVQTSICRGVPALAWQPMILSQRDAGLGAVDWALLAGCHVPSRLYVVRRARAGEYLVRYDGFGRTDPAQTFWVVVFAAPRGDFRALEVQSLQLALDLLRGERKGRVEAAPGGVDAFNAWIEALEEGSASLGHSMMHARYLRDMRRPASLCLREIASHYQPQARAHLLRAADLHAEEAREGEELIELLDAELRAKEPDAGTQLLAAGAARDMRDIEKEAASCIEQGLSFVQMAGGR